ncbi:hypothetical protein B0H16DRAFT_1553131, partial [Mycena metata]
MCVGMGASDRLAGIVYVERRLPVRVRARSSNMRGMRASGTGQHAGCECARARSGGREWDTGMWGTPACHRAAQMPGSSGQEDTSEVRMGEQCVCEPIPLPHPDGGREAGMDEGGEGREKKGRVGLRTSRRGNAAWPAIREVKGGTRDGAGSAEGRGDTVKCDGDCGGSRRDAYLASAEVYGEATADAARGRVIGKEDEDEDGMGYADDAHSPLRTVLVVGDAPYTGVGGVRLETLFVGGRELTDAQRGRTTGRMSMRRVCGR